MSYKNGYTNLSELRIKKNPSEKLGFFFALRAKAIWQNLNEKFKFCVSYKILDFKFHPYGMDLF